MTFWRNGGVWRNAEEMGVQVRSLHPKAIVTNNTWGGLLVVPPQQPQQPAVIDYNKHMSVDCMDQMLSYYPVVWKTQNTNNKWHKKLL